MEQSHLRALEKNILAYPASGTRYIVCSEYLKDKSPEPWWRAAVETIGRPGWDELPSKDYPEFLKDRRKLMVSKIRNYYKNL